MISTRQPAVRSLTLGVAAALALVAVSPTGASAAGGDGADGDAVVIDQGHVDAFKVVSDGSALDLVLKDDTGDQVEIRDPRDVLLHVKPQARITLPDPVPPSLEFLGGAGQALYYLPQTQDYDLLWPGWSTERPSGSQPGLAAGVVEGDVLLEIVEVEAPEPGNLWLWQTGPFGESTVLVDTAAGAPTTIPVAQGSHVHAEWAFDTEGTYVVHVRATGTTAAGEQVSSPVTPYTFVVGELPDQGRTTLSIDGLAPSYAAGDIVTLTAVQDPQTELDHYHWFTRPSPDAEWAIVPNNGTGTYSVTATEEMDGTQVQVRLYGEGHATVAESEPVTLAVATDGGGGGEPGPLEQRISFSLPQGAGALVASVDGDRDVVLPAPELAAAADRYVTEGALDPLVVTDTRHGAPGWNATARVGDFSSAGGSLAGEHLGWTPAVVAQPDGGGVVAGDAVPSGFGGAGAGLAESRVLGSAPAGMGAGTSRLGADLRLEIPTTTVAGEYVALLTMTVI